MQRRQIYKLIDEERERQVEKWNRPHDWGFGDCSSREVAPMTKLAVLTEEVGEVAHELLDGNVDTQRAEIIQVAAVAVAWLEGFGEEVSGG